MADTLITIVACLFGCAMVTTVLAFLIFSIDATIGRFFGFPRVLRHRGSGPTVVIGELGVLTLIVVIFAEPWYRGSITPIWLTLIVIVGLIMGFIGQGAARSGE